MCIYNNGTVMLQGADFLDWCKIEFGLFKLLCNANNPGTTAQARCGDTQKNKTNKCSPEVRKPLKNVNEESIRHTPIANHVHVTSTPNQSYNVVKDLKMMLTNQGGSDSPVT